MPSPHRRRDRRRFVIIMARVLVAPLLLASAACSDDSDSQGSTPRVTEDVPFSSSFPVTVQGANGSLTLDSAPQRVVSLSPSATEMLFAMGSGSQVAGVDTRSDYPREAPRTQLTSDQPDVDLIERYDPDLVVLSSDAGGVLAKLKQSRIPALQLTPPVTLAEAYHQMTTLGLATGHLRQAAVVAQKTQERIKAAVASVPKSSRSLRVYHEVDQNYSSLASNTLIGSLYTMFGLRNIADEAHSSNGYPKLSAEFVVTQKPDLIVLADQQDPDTLADRPSFASLPAIQKGRIVVINKDVASRWGPRMADIAETIAKGLKT